MTHPVGLGTDDIHRIVGRYCSGAINAVKDASEEIVEKVWLWGGEQCTDHGWEALKLRRQCTHCWGTLKEVFEGGLGETPD